MFIIQLARDLRMVFPTPTATATTIRAMHSAVGGAADAKKKMRVILIAFCCAFVLRVVSQYAVGILWDWHIFTWFFIWGGYNNLAIYVENWGWFIEWTPALIGCGMIVGLNTCFSMFIGSFLQWAVIGPILVAKGKAFGVNYGEGKWAAATTYYSLSLKDPINAPSPRYWILWP